MKIRLRVVLVICSLVLMVSCSNYPPVELEGTDINSLDFGIVLEDSIIYKLFIQVGSQGITLMEGELFNDGQVYGFNLLDRQLVLEKAEGSWTGDSVGISPDELRQTLSDLQLFLRNEYGRHSFEVRWFLLSHSIRVTDDGLHMYLYRNGNFYEHNQESEITEPCILVKAEDTVFFIFLN